MRWSFALPVLLIGSAVTFGQLSPDEATKRLQDRQAARQAERDKPVTVKRGDLDDLHAEVARLQKQVGELRQELSAAKAALPTTQPMIARTPGPAANAPNKNLPANAKIELKKGMKFDDVRLALGPHFGTTADADGKTCHWILAHERRWSAVGFSDQTMREVRAHFDLQGFLDWFDDQHLGNYDAWNGDAETWEGPRR